MAAEPCNHCRPALEALRHRNDSDEVEPVSRECAMVIVNYLISLIDHKSCRCLLKIPDVYVAMHQVILDLIELSTSLIVTLNEDLVQLAEMEGSGVVSPNGTKQNTENRAVGEELSLSGDESESMDLDTSSGLLVPPASGEVKGFTLEDRKEIFHLLPFLLTDHYLFYSMYNKYHGTIGDRRLTLEKERYAGNYFDTSGFSPPYVLTMAAVRENGLLDRLCECFVEAKPGVMPLQIALKLIQVLATLKRFANDQTVFNKIYPARDAALKFICALADEQSEILRDPFMRNCAEQLWVLGREYLEDTLNLDTLGLDLIVAHFSSPYLAPRLTALTQLNMYISVCTELLHTDSANSVEDLVTSMSEYLSGHKVLQLLFGPNSHVELLKQCPNLLNFLAFYEKISKDDLDCIWSAAQMKHCGRQVFDLLTLIIKGLDPQLLLHLYSLLKALKPNEHNELTLQLTSYVIKMLWSYALCRSSFATIPNQPSRMEIMDTSQRMAACDGKFTNRLDVSSGDSTQASTTCGEDPAEAGSKGNKSEELEGHTKSKISPPTLIESDTNEKKSQGKRIQEEQEEEMEEENEEVEERPSSCPEPRQKRARVLIEMADDTADEMANTSKQSELKVKVGDVSSRDQQSPGDSSATSSTESSTTDDADGRDGSCDEPVSSRSSDASLDGRAREQVKRLLQHAKFPAPGLTSPVMADFARVSGMGWVTSQESTSGLLESLVKQKDLSDQRGYNDSDSDISSDAATSSDRVNDLDDDDELAVAVAESGVDNKLRSFIGQLHRPSHSSPVVDDVDEEGTNGSSSADPALAIDTVSRCSPPRHGSNDSFSSKFRSLKQNLQRQATVQQQQQQQAVAAAAALQLHQHNRHILTHLAPHAKSFWQSKYSQLNESDQALFDLNLVCEPGHTLLWDLVVDDESGNSLPAVLPSPNNEHRPAHQQSERLSSELQSYALQVLEEVVAWAPSIFIKKFFVRGCVEHLRKHKCVAIVLPLVRKIMASFRQIWRSASGVHVHTYNHGESEETNAVVWADNELDLLTAFFDDLTHFRRHQEIQEDGRFSVERELRARVEFLDYVFSSHGTPTNYQITVEQLNILWDCLSMDSCGEELLHKWLLDQLRSQSQHALNTELLNYILISKVVSFKPETLSNAGLAFLQAVLQETSARSAESGVEAGVQVCVPLIWSAAMRNIDSTVAMAAMTFISNYYVHTGGSPQKELQFIDSCMSHLRFACEAMMVESQLSSSLMCIQRAIMILRSHIDAFRRRHAFHLRMWELEGRGVKSHMQCVPHAALVESMPVIRVTLQAPGVEKKAVIEISATDLLGHLRAEVTYWWKNAKKSSISPQSANGRGSGTTARKTSSTPAFSFDLNSDFASQFFEVNRPVAVTAPMNVTVPTTLSASSSSSGGFIPLSPSLLKSGKNDEEESIPSDSQIVSNPNGPHNPILGALLANTAQQRQTGQLNDGPLRLLCGGRELTVDLDEKNVLEVGLRDGSIIHVQSSAAPTGGRQGVPTDHMARYPAVVTSKEKNYRNVAPPDPASIPMSLLSLPTNWQLLMNLIKSLIDRAATGSPDLSVKCRSWSYRAWEVIQLLPTYPPCVEQLQQMLEQDSVAGGEDGGMEVESGWKQLFDSSNLHYFLYSMQCLEMLAHKRDKFTSLGGMKHLIGVLVDRSLFPKENGNWSEWEVECLTAVLRVAHNFATELSTPVTSADLAPMRATAFRTIHHHRSTKLANLQMMVPTLDMGKFDGIDRTQLVSTIMDLISEFCTERQTAQVCGLVSRLHGLQCAFQLLIAFLLNDEQLRREFRFGSVGDNAWLKRVLLDSQDPNLRREVSASLYRLCRGGTKDGSGNGRYLTPRLTVSLLSILKDAKDLPPFPCAYDDSHSMESASAGDHSSFGLAGSGDHKEPHGASPSSYFWLLTNLLESLLRRDDVEMLPNVSISNKETAQAEREIADAEFSVDLDTVAAEIAKFIIERPFYEWKYWSKGKQSGNTYGGNRSGTNLEGQQMQMDAGLVGLIQIAIAIMKFNPTWKFSSDGQAFVQSVCDLIFALPTPKNGRYHPKCQSPQSRVAAFDLLVEMAKGCDENFTLLYKKLLHQNSKDSHDSYGWEYWPQEERRAPCGYVGLMNLGATCYMASTMQQLYLIPRFRAALLNARVAESTKHEDAFREIQKMFAFLLESERKAYNPRAFCKAYQMNHQPLNITEQKDMAEFCIDLITKLEEMSPDLKRVVKSLFCGVMSNNVVSLDCPHVSKTLEDFYTVRCQVADMKDLQESLSELTVGDMLEGDNMYTCSQCNKKVRAEKRACFQKLPRILCFNTMRYTFNMITMMKEKVNTHFSFPFRLNMSAFMEENLLPSHASGEDTNDSTAWGMKTSTYANEYELIGVTVHTGTAEGGHYYSFIRDRSPSTDPSQPRSPETDRWYSFNDAEVRPWDPAQMAAECFGGELTRQQYDTVAEKYLDLSFEKTNSAYMLFYERVSPIPRTTRSLDTKPSFSGKTSSAAGKGTRQMSIYTKPYPIELTVDIERWICEDNVRFIQDLMFFDQAYFNFVWQICSHVPATLLERDPAEITFQSAKLSLCFVLETLLHSKEKATISQWLELILKELSSSQKTCEWFLTRMAKNGDWPAEILLGCPSKSCREVFQKLCYHAILELHLKHEQLYLLPWTPDRCEKYDAFDPSEIGNQSCVGKFIKRLLTLLNTQHANVETRQLNEYFGLLLEFAKSRPAALTFLHLVGAINSICTLYMKRSAQDSAEVESEEDGSDEETGNLMSLVRVTCGLRAPSVWSPAVLERMLKLVTLLLETGRMSGGDGFKLRQKDLQAVINGKGFPFLMQMIRDVANPTVSGPLILSVCAGNTTLGTKIIETIFETLRRLRDDTEAYFNLLSYFVDMAEKSMLRSGRGAMGMETAASTSFSSVTDYSNIGVMAYVKLILERMWELAEVKSVCALKWLERNVSNHRSILFDALINNMKYWVERYLLASAPYQARVSAGELLLSLIPSSSLRTSFAAIGKGINVSSRPAISSEAASVLHRVYDHLLWLLRNKAASYAVIEQNGTHRLVTFFQTMKTCLVSKDEKLMVVPYVADIWSLFHTQMMEKPVKIYANKQALLTFWYMACVDCPEMVQASVTHPGVQQYFMYNYIHVSDDDDDLTNSNKVMLHAFYGLMRLFCVHSPSFCELLIRHENMNFACQTVATKDVYREAREEIFGAIEICCKQPTIRPNLLIEFKERVWSLFLTMVSKSRANFPLLLRFLKISLDTPQDKALLLQHNILPVCSDAFCTLHKMHHEASGCNVLGDLSEILKRFCEILKFATKYSPTTITSSATFNSKSTAAAGTGVQAPATPEEAFEETARQMVAKAVREWLNMTHTLHRLLELLNSYIPMEIRRLSIDCIKEIVVLNEAESLAAILPEIKRVHTHCRAATTISTSVGPYFPKRGQTSTGITPFRRIHPPRPMFNMCLQATQLEASKGVDPTYDQMLLDYFQPYHSMVDRLLRIAFNLGPEIVAPELLAEVSCLLGCDGVPLHFALFPKLWLDLWQRLREGKDLQKQIDCLCQCPLLRDYLESALVQEQHSLVNSQIFNFVQIFLDKCQQPIHAEKIQVAIDNAIASLLDLVTGVESILQATSSNMSAPTATAVYREFDRVPVCFSRARGTLRALFLLYCPDKMPDELYKGEIRKRLVEVWIKLKSLFQEKSMQALTISTTTEGSGEMNRDESSSSHESDCQRRKEIETKLHQLYSELMTDSQESIGMLLNRLEIPELPVESSECCDETK